MALQPNQVGAQMGMGNIPNPTGFLGSLKNFALGTPQQVQQLSPYSQQQQMGTSQLLQQGLQGIQQTPISFEPIKQRLLKTYQEQIVPSLATRFSSMGSGGAQGSSAFRGSLAESGGDILQRLGELENQYNLLGRQQGIDLARLGLTPQYENIIQGREPGILENALVAYLSGAGGAHLGQGLGNLLSGRRFGGQERNAAPEDKQSQIRYYIQQLQQLLGEQ